MGLAVVTGPVIDPVSLAEAKAHCRIDIDDDDGLLAGYILAARQYVETYIRAPLITQTFDYTLDYGWPSRHPELTNVGLRAGYFGAALYGFGAGILYGFGRITLPRSPVQSVTYVKYLDTNGVQQTLATDQYVGPTLLDTGDYVLEPAYGVTWPQVRPQPGAITVRFVAGFGNNPGDIPEPIRQAMLLLIHHFYDNRNEIVAEPRIVPTLLPMGSEALLWPYRTRLI